ncbi:phosphoribosylglycinamide formyltransferase [Vandammella animalimorsus]|uniref:Phosphoribosylglycinamide formyltransferase n=1 Tax=Vandammella animalimorsus TaxID=2029117 RepID=A0A2A2ALC9_9BURK|nr:phosphoribosylglycinamide formyltransferase [Vandammella animalimorsus]PAT38587.1 phosphoribosylglycinamide formyltransferase [Vandammella animalimorsus]
MKRKNIVILISGTGSNMAAIVQAQHAQQWPQRLNAQVSAVISNRADAAGLQWARERGIATQVVDHRQYPSREAFDAELAQAIEAHQPALVALAGFMRVLGDAFVNRFSGRLINIHPSLLPAFPGLHTHQRALDAGCRFAGATVHWVIPELDAGPIIDQAAVPILPGDTAATLAARVQSQEHLLYPRAIAAIMPTLR